MEATTIAFLGGVLVGAGFSELIRYITAKANKEQYRAFGLGTRSGTRIK